MDRISLFGKYEKYVDFLGLYTTYSQHSVMT